MLEVLETLKNEFGWSNSDFIKAKKALHQDLNPEPKKCGGSAYLDSAYEMAGVSCSAGAYYSIPGIPFIRNSSYTLFPPEARACRNLNFEPLPVGRSEAEVEAAVRAWHEAAQAAMWRPPPMQAKIPTKTHPLMDADLDFETLARRHEEETAAAAVWAVRAWREAALAAMWQPPPPPTQAKIPTKTRECRELSNAEEAQVAAQVAMFMQMKRAQAEIRIKSYEIYPTTKKTTSPAVKAFRASSPAVQGAVRRLLRREEDSWTRRRMAEAAEVTCMAKEDARLRQRMAEAAEAVSQALRASQASQAEAARWLQKSVEESVEENRMLLQRRVEASERRAMAEEDVVHRQRMAAADAAAAAAAAADAAAERRRRMASSEAVRVAYLESVRAKAALRDAKLRQQAAPCAAALRAAASACLNFSWSAAFRPTKN